MRNYQHILSVLLSAFFLLFTACSEEVTDPTPVEKGQETKEVLSTEEEKEKDSHEKEKVHEEEHEQEDHKEVEKETDKEEKTEKSLAPLMIHYIDAGQADATLLQVEGEEPFTILYDAGDWNKNDVVQYLQNQGIQEIDLIVASHPHADHIGQLAQIIETFEVREVWDSGNIATSKTYERAMEAILTRDINYHEPRAGESYDLGTLHVEVLHPEHLTGGLNEDSISLLFTYGTMKFLFTGDAYKEQERQMLQRKDNLEATILHLGHHGSSTSTDATFLKTVNPEVAIYSAGANNSYGHPHVEVVTMMEEENIPLYGTDVHGTIIVETDGKDFTLETEKDGTVQAGREKSAKDKEKKKTKEVTTASGDCVDLNEASAEELQQIIHIGPVRAEEVIKLRPFKSVGDLNRVKGIGPARINDIESEGLACVKE